MSPNDDSPGSADKRIAPGGIDTQVLSAEIVTLADSPAITEAAISAVVSAQLPLAVAIGGQVIDLAGTVVNDRLSVACTWPTGSCRIRIGLSIASSERNNPEDHGHRRSLQVWSETGSRETAWNGLERFVRDAIRDGDSTVSVAFWTSFMERGEAEEETGIGNADLGYRARELFAEIGLGGARRVEVGVLDLAAREWRAGAAATLERLVIVGLIKTVLRDRGRGRLIKGTPPFSVRATVVVELPSWDEPISATRYSGVHSWFGGADDQVAGLRDALRFVAENTPTEVEFEEWIRAQGDVAHSRLDIYSRMLLHLGLLARDVRGRWNLTDAGVACVENAHVAGLYPAFVARYTGFEEALAYFGRNPGGRVEGLRADLVARTGTEWTGTAQPYRRAQWLRAMGLLTGARGTWTLTEAGKALFEKLPVTLRRDIHVSPAPTPEPDPPDPEGAPPPEPLRLQAEDVPVGDLEFEGNLLQKAVGAINAGKHLLFVGPPGTGKSAIAAALANHAAEVFDLNEPLLATASADWSGYDTIGGWSQRKDKHLEFRAGVFTSAIRDRSWLVLDELNRADVDKCLGEAFTVLAGGKAQTAFEGPDGRAISIGRDCTYDPGSWFRVIATMNVRDKATLFRLSYALLRRFAVIEVPAPSDEVFRSIARRDAEKLGIDLTLAELAASVFTRGQGLGDVVELGPAMLRDILRYVKQRGASVLAVAEGVDLFVLPQLDGLEEDGAQTARKRIRDLFSSDTDARRELVARFDAYFSHVRFDDRR